MNLPSECRQIPHIGGISDIANRAIGIEQIDGIIFVRISPTADGMAAEEIIRILLGYAPLDCILFPQTHALFVR